ncbi:MAG: sugar phosphate isomerase/epimerase family protein [Candidatus Firestonebacteria bacterium]
MKKAINYWSFPGGLEGKKSLKEAINEAKKYGFEGIELCMFEEGEVSLKTTKSDCESFLNEAKKAGICISSLATGIFWSYNLGSSKKADREKAGKVVEKMLELASYLKVDTILVVPGAVDVFFNPSAEIVSYDDVYNRVKEGLKKLVPIAEKYKVCIGLENVWNKFFLSPVEVKDFVDSFKSNYLGVYFDVGNVLPFGYPEQWIKILGKRIKKVHLKDFRFACGHGGTNGFVDLLEGDVNWPEVIKALKEVGYDGYLVAEMIPGYRFYPEVRLGNTSKAMDAILGRK